MIAVKDRTKFIGDEKDFLETRNSIAMLVLLISFSMLFATLLLSYTVYRFSNTVWPPLGFEIVPLLRPSLSTALMFLSSIAFYMCEKSYELNKQAAFKFYLITTLVLGFAFLGMQVLLWSHLKSLGLYVETGIFSSILHGFTWIHAAHVVLGLVGLFYILPLAFQKEFADKVYYRITNIGKFWHFLGVVWFIMYIVLFVI